MARRDTNKDQLGSLHRRRGLRFLAARLRLSKAKGTYLNVTIAGPFMINHDDGSALPFCDLGCYNTYTYYVDGDLVESGKIMKAKKGVCFHCAACGRIIFKNTKCVLHVEGCPEYIWTASVPAVEEFKAALAFYLKLEEIPVLIWDTADEVAANNSLIPGSEIALLTIEKLGLA